MTALSGEEGFDLFAFDSKVMDICDEAQVCEIFEKDSPDFVINCAAYTRVDDAEEDREAAFKLNADAVENLAKCCAKENAVLLHFSTDYVFDGEKDGGYYEDDEPSPISVYGESKLKGEELLAEALKEHYIVRTSLLFGENGQNFVNLMCRLFKEHDEVKVIGDKVASPTYAKDLAGGCVERFVLPFVSRASHPKDLLPKTEGDEQLPFGIYHLSNDGACSRFELAQEIARITGSDVRLTEVESDFFKPKARRPANSELLSRKTPTMRHWKEALEAYLA